MPPYVYQPTKRTAITTERFYQAYYFSIVSKFPTAFPRGEDGKAMNHFQPQPEAVMEILVAVRVLSAVCRYHHLANTAGQDNQFSASYWLLP